jgi:hypothetical protein
MSDRKRVTVSITKLIEFLSKHQYGIIAVYVCGDMIRFIETRTPKYQKNFIIFVPEKYKMEPNSIGSRYKIINILSSQGESSRQSDYLDTLKGSFIDCDLTSVSSKFVYIYRNDGTTEMYSIGLKDTLEVAEPKIQQKETPAQKAIKDTTEVFASLKETLEIPSIDIVDNGGGEEDDGEEDDGDDVDTTVDDGGDTIELEFEDDEGVSVEDMVEFIEPPPFRETKIRKLGETSSEEIKSTSISTYQDTKSFGSSNFKNIIEFEDEDIILGIIYYTINLLVFYKNIKTLEDKIVSVYDTIEDNINSIREDRVSIIEELTEHLLIKLRSSHEKYIVEESELKVQLIKLSSIFEQTAGLKNKINDDTKYSNAKGDIERVYNQTRNTIRDLNLELLRLRDSFDELLDNTHTALQEITKH